MARWLIEIVGKPFDVEEYPIRFPIGEVFAIRQGDRVFLTGPRFDRAGAAGAVRDEAGIALRELFGVVSLLWPAARLPSIGNVQKEHDDGRRDSFSAVGSAEMRIKAGSVSLSVSGQSRQLQHPQITRGRPFMRSLWRVRISPRRSG